MTVFGPHLRCGFAVAPLLTLERCSRPFLTQGHRLNSCADTYSGRVPTELDLGPEGECSEWRSSGSDRRRGEESSRVFHPNIPLTPVPEFTHSNSALIPHHSECTIIPNLWVTFGYAYCQAIGVDVELNSRWSSCPVPAVAVPGAFYFRRNRSFHRFSRSTSRNTFLPRSTPFQAEISQ